MKNRHLQQSGQILVLAIVVVGLVLINSLIIIGGARLFYQNTIYTTQASQAVNLAEAGIDKAVASLNATAGSYNGESETFLGSGSFGVTVTSKDATTVIIKSTGYIPNKTNPQVKRSVQVQVSKGTGISFIYGMLVGEGGIIMGNGSTINGSVYSNGSIRGPGSNEGNNELVTGDVFVAGGTQPAANQESDCVIPSCGHYIFGKNVAGEHRLDVAQSFQSTASGVLNKVSLKLKKNNSPANPAVRILADNNGSPNKDQILASGTLSANLVTDEYGFIDVTFTSPLTITADTTYWIMVAAQTLDNSNYWVWSEDTVQGYTRGSPKWSSDWQDKNPVWNSITADLGFKTWMGGVSTTISLGNGTRIQGNVKANTIQGVTIDGDAYYQTISNSTVNGTSYPNSPDPVPMPMPISESNINEWETQSQDHGLISSTDITGCPATLGPGKIDANLTTTNNCTITITPPLWITGNLTFGNYTVFQLNPALGGASGMIIVDGKTVFGNNNNILGSGSGGSYLTLLSTYDSVAHGGTLAIDSRNSSITGILYAPYGTVALANNAEFTEVVAWQIEMGTGTVLNYDSGLIGTFFSAGPNGSFSVIKGTYQVKQ